MCRDIDCDFERKTNFVYSVRDKKKLLKELEAAKKLGIPMKYTDSVSLPIKTVGAVYCENQAQFNPLKLLFAIAKDLHIFEDTQIIKVDGNTAFTDKHRITADSIVFATHFPFIDSHGFYFMKLYQSRSYVIALEKAPDVGGMYIDESDKGLSFRNYKDLLFIGGSNHRTGKKSEAYEPLRAFAKEHYPSLKESYHGASQDCMSLDSAPYIGHYSKHTANCYTATGFNKWGMTGAMVGATLIRDIICGIGAENNCCKHKDKYYYKRYADKSFELVYIFSSTETFTALYVISSSIYIFSINEPVDVISC
jgi:glycine/D-amino acid oxidase-like deaminating enzyme